MGSSRTHVLQVAAVAAALFLLAICAPPLARAINTQAGPTTAVDPAIEYATATWTWSQYRTTGNENVAGFSVTLPPGTDASLATSVGRAGTVVVTGAPATGQTVAITFNTRIPRNTNFSVSIGGVVNPVAGTYPADTITFSTTDRNGNNPGTQTLATGAVTITPDPGFLTLTITTPNAAQTVDFGSLDPGSTSSATVTLSVTSSVGYLLSRSLEGDIALLGLSASGLPSDIQGPGTSEHTDTLSVAPPWTTDPDIARTAIVIYTVTQP